MKGEYKVECKKWSAKGTYRKASEGGVQKVECKRQVQKGKCRQGTHDGLKHARWPATTCGSLTRIPPGQDLGLLRSPTSTKTEQKWDRNRSQMRPIWARGGGGQGHPKNNDNMKKYKKRKRKETK
jgi:hypothetical protein